MVDLTRMTDSSESESDYTDDEFEEISLSSNNDSILYADSSLEYDVDDPDSEYERMMEQIYNSDSSHLDKKKEQDHYYIGIYKHIHVSGNLVFINSISNDSFLSYPYIYTYEYLKEYSLYQDTSNTVDIMKLYIKHETYYVVLKTYWIRLIQRVWKRKYLEYKARLQKLISPSSLHYRQKHGYFHKDLTRKPTIVGMLSQL